MSPRWRFAVILGLVIASGVLVAVGCSGPSGDDGASASKVGGGGSPDGTWAEERSATKGPLVATVRTSVDELTIADTVTLRVDFDAREDCRPTLPAVDAFPVEPAFRVDGYRTERPTLDSAGRLRSAAEFELEPILTGDQTVGPFTFEFTLEGDEPAEDGRDKVYTLEVEAIPVGVVSLTAAASAELDIRPLADLVDPAEVAEAREVSSRWIFIAAGAVLLLAAAIAWIVVRSRRGEQVAEVELPSPREAALAALAELERQPAVD